MYLNVLKSNIQLLNFKFKHWEQSGILKLYFRILLCFNCSEVVFFHTSRKNCDVSLLVYFFRVKIIANKRYAIPVYHFYAIRITLIG